MKFFHSSDRKIAQIILLNGLFLIRSSLSVSIPPPANNNNAPAPVGNAGTGGNLPNSGDAKMGASNFGNGQNSGVMANTNDPNNPSVGGNSPNLNSNGQNQNNNGLLQATTPSNLQNGNINNGVTNNQMPPKNGAVLNGEHNNPTIPNGNPGVTNGNKQRSNTFGANSRGGPNNGTDTHHAIGNSAKQTQNNPIHDKSKKSSGHKSHASGATSFRKLPNEFWLTTLQVLIAIIVPFLTNKAVHIL